jgi:hypothetical protein
MGRKIQNFDVSFFAKCRKLNSLNKKIFFFLTQIFKKILQKTEKKFFGQKNFNRKLFNQSTNQL